MYQLPTRSPTVYRGKHPTKIRMLGYSNSLSQQTIGAYLSINRPVHIELYNGTRYIAASAEVNMDLISPGSDLNVVLKEPVTPIEQLTQERYDEMLELIRKQRGY